MKNLLIVSIGLFVISCYAAESSTQSREPWVQPITLIHDERTFTSHVNLFHKDSTRKSMAEHVTLDLPCVWALVHCKSSSRSTGVKRKLRDADEIHTKVAAYNEKHTKRPIVRDPRYYLVWQDVDGALKGILLGREKNALSKKPGYGDLKCMLTETNLPARALATLRQYMEGNLYNQAVNWYQNILKYSQNGEDLVAMADSRMEWWYTLHEVGYACFHHGEYAKAIEIGQQSLRFNHDTEMTYDTAGLLCRAYVALEQWDKALALEDILDPRRNPHAKKEAWNLKALAEAHEHTLSLKAALGCGAQVIDLERYLRSTLEHPIAYDEEYAPTCMHLMYYYAALKNPLEQFPPELAERLVIAATAVNKIPELLTSINEGSQQHCRYFANDIKAYQERYPGRYEIATQTALDLLAQRESGQNKEPLAPVASSGQV